MNRITLVLSVMLLALQSIDGARAQPVPPERDVRELIVLLEPGSLVPDEVVDRVNRGQAVPGLEEGNPMAARMVVREPARHRLAEWIAHNPETPEGRAHRFIVLRYPDHANLEAIMTALARNPNVQNVERNLAFDLHAAPTNDAFVGDSDDYEVPVVGDPEAAQWGVHVLNLPGGWARLGLPHAYLGFIDEGLMTTHSDLRASHLVSGQPVFDGGAFRAHLSRDVANTSTDCSVDEVDPSDTPGNFDPTPGHGSHVTGIATATTNNGQGVAGACPGCSALVAKASPAPDGTPPPQQIVFDRVFDAMDFLVNHGAQAVNMSFGSSFATLECGDPVSALNLTAICNGLALGEKRDVVMVASSGNKATSNVDVDFPARDSRTIAVGGLEVDALGNVVLWNDCTTGTFGCGSTWGPSLDLMAPAKAVLSTVYAGFDHLMSGTCGDSNFTLDGPDGGYGLCTGTSMAAPQVTGLTGMVRTPNPWLGKEDVRDVLTSTASIPGLKDPQLAHGLPDAGTAMDRAFGQVAGRPLLNRLAPLVSLHSLAVAGAPKAETHVYTTVPQVASAFLLNDVRLFDTVGPATPFYGAFPGFCATAAPDCCPQDQSCCVGQGPGCVAKILAASDTRPRASVYVFTGDVPPTPASPPLVPLYRLRFESALSDACQSPQSDPISPVRDFAYATSAAEVAAYLSGVNLGGTIYKYKLDGIEGFVYQHCASGCAPGAVALHHLYSTARHDTVVVPSTEVAAMQALGYSPPTDPALPEVIGWAFPNVDTDLDGLIDGFERLVGTGPADADSDDDGVSDGAELLVYDRSNPDPALRGYRDPCSTPSSCPLFADGFESGNTSQWSVTVQ